MMNSTLLAVFSVAFVVVAQIPTDTTIGDITKWGGVSGLTFIIWYLSCKVIPQMTRDHKEAMGALGAELRGAIDRGHDRTNELLESTLSQLIEHRRDGGPKV